MKQQPARCNFISLPEFLFTLPHRHGSRYQEFNIGLDLEFRDPSTPSEPCTRSRFKAPVWEASVCPRGHFFGQNGLATARI